ncbi:pheromone-processing carboxypeptidase KEX1-like [Papaver somniferum]|uniref:pheromone-processing carboxypeptidase KEX1-like n=1 Tax=Papaver somniferum TaxID=3469 RepID=UPI000E6FB222|nr:pheromone-processing carboxypeptidase KEX1-like [Papaver somniferum]
MGHSPHIKLVTVMKCLCKSTPADSADDYTRMGATTIYMYLKRFFHTVCMNFGARYLREPTPEDVHRLLAENADRGFSGMLGSVDCMQWPWKNCLVAWQGTYRGSNNDLNVLAHSPLFDNMLKGVEPPCNYVINDHQYNMGYFLADGIYPKLTTIVQAFSQTLDIPNFVRFNKYQMAKRKDVERAFGVLQEGDYDDTYLEEEEVPGQNEDGAFEYYGDYNNQTPDEFQQEYEHVNAYGHVRDEYQHDGDDDEDSGDEEDSGDYDEYEKDDAEEDDDDDAPHDDAGGTCSG